MRAHLWQCAIRVVILAAFAGCNPFVIPPANPTFPPPFPTGYQITVVSDPPSGVAPLTVRLRATVTPRAPANPTGGTPTPGPCFFPPFVYEFGDGVSVSPVAACGVVVSGPLTLAPPTPTPRPYPVTTQYVSEPHTYTQAGTYHAAVVLRWQGQELRGETVVPVQ